MNPSTLKAPIKIMKIFFIIVFSMFALLTVPFVVLRIFTIHYSSGGKINLTASDTVDSAQQKVQAAIPNGTTIKQAIEVLKSDKCYLYISDFKKGISIDVTNVDANSLLQARQLEGRITITQSFFGGIFFYCPILWIPALNNIYCSDRVFYIVMKSNNGVITGKDVSITYEGVP